MPKIKTHKSMAKRIKITGTGKIRHDKARKSHLMTNKGRSDKSFLYGKEISPHHVNKIQHLLPYSF